MDWIEQLLGLSPDAGSGATELQFVLAVALALAAIAVGIAARRRASRVTSRLF